MRQMTSTPKTSFVAALIAAVLVNLNLSAQTPSLEFASGASNPTGNGPTVANQVIRFQNNTNNPTGNTLATYNPSLTATFAISNQQYNLPTSQVSTGKGLSFGGNQSNSSILAPASALFAQMNSIGSPANNNFTSAANVTAGTGIDISTNRAVGMFVSAKALDNANASTGGRFYFGDLTITFNQGVTNPVVHVVGLGGFYHSLGFTAELELQTSNVVLSKLSGSGEFNVTSGTKILNSALHPNSPTGSGAASGSALASGSNITSLTFRVYLRGDGSDNEWSGSTDHQGDVFLVGVSFNTPIEISGSVSNDKDGLTDNKVDGSGIAKPSNIQLYANLLNVSNKVLTSVAVAADGKYTFTNVGSNTNYSVQISTNPGTMNQSAPVAALPTNWVYTGENLGNGSGNDGSANGVLAVPVANNDVKDVNFGIEQTPTSDTKWYGIGTPVVNSFRYLTGIGLIPGALSGLDLEDGLLGLLGKVAITSLPSGNNQLWYNGVQITKGVDNINVPSVSNPYIINNYTLALLAVRFTGVGSNQTTFNYAFYDAANRMSTTPASYTLNWTSVLPVELTSFTASLNNNSVDVKWTTATEIDLSHFVIEKSNDGTNFTQAGVVFANGNSTEKLNYNFTDNNLSSNVIYYRLCSVGKDGKVEYSETRVIRIEKQATKAITLAAYPNPVINELRVTIPATWQGKKVNYEVFGNNGQAVIRNEAANASQTETVNFSKLAPGFYVIKASCNGEIAQQKIIKQ